MDFLNRVIRKIKRESRHLANRWRYEFVYVLSDSHGNVFSHLNNRPGKTIHFDVTVVGGGTAMGMVNPNSKTDCLNIYRRKMASLAKNSKVIFLLGEVDTGFVIWYRAQKHGLSVDSQFEQSLKNYFAFVDLAIDEGFVNLAMMSAPLPTIEDNDEKHGEIAGLRREVTVSQHDRTELTLRYNERIAEFCQQRGLVFLNLDEYLLGNDRLIRREFLNRDKQDHHCDHEAYGGAIQKDLMRIGWIRSAQVSTGDRN